MTKETLSHEMHAGEAHMHDQDEVNRFFDPPAPEQPEQVFGVDTEAILDLGRAATALGALPPKVNLGLYALPDAVRVVPLVEEMQSAGDTLSPEDVRPYRKPIKKLSPGVNFADKLAAGASVAVVGIPIRRALNSKIEREFPRKASEAIDRTREVIAGIEQDVNYLAEFENPKAQFTTEMNELAGTVTGAITQQRDRRIQSGSRDRDYYQKRPDSITPKGMLGLLTKAVRKVRDFFGLFERHKKPANHEITAYDAGEGISQVLGSLTRNKELAEGRFPLLSKTIFSRIPDNVKMNGDRMALVAPEALNFLFSIAPDHENHRKMLESVRRNPHELRFVTHFKKHYGRYYLDGVQRASRTLIPAIRDVLPSHGANVRETYANVQTFLESNRAWLEVNSKRDDDNTPEQERPRGFRNRLKALFHRQDRNIQ